ncbi:MAG: hypothetical protein WBA12_01675 [Catalinimonas sp.]
MDSKLCTEKPKANWHSLRLRVPPHLHGCDQAAVVRRAGADLLLRTHDSTEARGAPLESCPS